MGHLRRKAQRFQFKSILTIALVFALIAVILFVELTGVQFRYVKRKLELLQKDQIVTKEQSCAALEIDTLLLWNRDEESSSSAMEEFEVILADMKVGYRSVDISKEEIPDYAPYQVVIPLLENLTPMGDKLQELCQWVRGGGNVMFPLTLEINPYTASIENKLGIQSSGEYAMVESIYLYEGFMVGGGSSFAVPDGYESARAFRLVNEDTQVYAAAGDAQGVPLVWTRRYGEGMFVVDNFGICDKAFRGFYAASLSLLTPVYVYPVINGSVFYLDDFPSQIPQGDNEYISRDYNTNVRDFYLNIWWPDMMNIADRYGIRYTGLAIESYDDIVDGSTPADPERETFLQIGNMVLRQGGELGYHGYNHQPLVLGNNSYDGLFDYKTWDSYDAMNRAFQTLVDFCDELFPSVKMAVYVPPSNILSKEGLEMLKREYPNIRTYSGIYFPDKDVPLSLLQEFEVDENGIVDQPRTISGCVLGEYMTVGALSELNMHFVNNHFTHPDDALDPDRGAELGWKELTKRFDSFLSWIYGSAKGLRNFTGTELSAAVQRFAAVTPKREVQEDKMVLTLEHFYDEAQFLVRFNSRTPGRITGGKLTRVTGDLYLLEATQATVTVYFQ